MLIVLRTVALLFALHLSLAPAPPWGGLPLRTTTKSHLPGDPINIAFEGSRMAILAAFARAGWVKADPLSLRDDSRLVRAALVHKPYPTAPVSNLYLFGRPEDFAVEHEIGTIAQRDHVRLWATGRVDPGTHLAIWIGDASRDTAVELLKRHGIPVGTTHHIDPNLDGERQRIITQMRATGLVSTVIFEPGAGPTRNGRNGGGDLYYTDGRVALIILRG